MKILVVEDDPVSMRLVVGVLEGQQYETETASDVRHAISILESDPHIDLIVMDIMMPKVDGLQFLRYLKSTLRFSKVPVVMCTALHDVSTVAKSIELGAVDYIVKPIEAPMLLEKVRNGLKHGLGSILVVCEEEIELGILVRTIGREGFRCVSCRNGEEAWAKLKEERISLIVAELLLPGMSGYELLVKTKEEFPTIPVVLIADSRSERAKEEIISAGADGYIVKPFTNVDITRRIASLVQ